MGTQWTGTWCPQCGFDVTVDDDGCCSSCGATSVGEAVEQLIAKNEAKARIASVLPHIALAIKMAEIEVPDGIVSLGVIAKRADGSGRVTASFEAVQFIADLETLTANAEGENSK